MQQTVTPGNSICILDGHLNFFFKIVLIYRTESYTSIFHLLRAGLCPYFYMCCHQFTVAFFAARTRSDQMEAVVTPTSRGLREALKAEDIEFTLPLQARRTSTEKPVQTNRTQGEESTNHSSPKAELKYVHRIFLYIPQNSNIVVIFKTSVEGTTTNFSSTKSHQKTADLFWNNPTLSQTIIVFAYIKCVQSDKLNWMISI